MKTISWYLSAIRQKKSISKRSFFKQWDKSGLGYAYAHQLFTFEAGDKGIVVVEDAAAFDDLYKQYGVTGTKDSRAEAAIGYNSHGVGVDGSLLMVRNSEDTHPQVIMIVGGEVVTPRPLKPEVLIVENLQNFLSLSETLSFVERHSEINASHVDVIWGNGNGINNALHTELLNTFKQTWWLTDADLGGLTIMATALNNLPTEKFNIIVPIDIELRLQRHGKKIASDKRAEVIVLASKHPILVPMAKAIIDTHRHLEQESYLLDNGVEAQ
jgi:hypothetical protein